MALRNDITNFWEDSTTKTINCQLIEKLKFNC